MTIATLGSMRTKAIVRRESLMRTFSGQFNCSHGLVGRGSGIRLLMRASKLPRSTSSTELQLETLGKNLAIPTMLIVVVIESIARMKSMTRSSKRLRIGRPKRRSGDYKHSTMYS